MGSTSENTTDGDSSAVVGGLVFRAITRGDIVPLAGSVADAFTRYRSFAPDGWQPPTADTEAQVLQRWLADPGFWGEVAFEQSTLVGHATFISAAHHSFRREPDESLAHLGHLFVTPEYWGSGAATELMAHATRAARTLGFRAMRLFVPEGQTRARRFYEREGFSGVGEPFQFGLGLAVLEYRHSI